MAGRKVQRTHAILPLDRACKTCRARRVKCDAGRPVCRNCERKGRTCLGYDTNSVRVINSPNFQGGDSKWHAAGGLTAEDLAVVQRLMIRTQQLQISPTSRTDSLSKQLVSECRRVWRGRLWWIGHVCRRLDEVDAPELVAATEALVTGLVNEVVGGDSLVGLKSHARCCRLLRDRPLSCESSLLAILLLSLREVRKRAISSEYGLHVGALVSIILSDPQKWAKNEIAKCITYFDHVTVAGAALKRGESSPFDTELWLSQAPPSLNSSGVPPLRRTTHEYWVKLPGLVAKMRRIRESSAEDSDPDEAMQIVNCLRDILSQRDMTAERSLLERCSSHRTISELDQVIIPLSYSFDSAIDYDTLITYYASRSILWMGHSIMCRVLCEKYGRLPDRLPPPAMELFATERSDLVHAILMCWEEYARAQSFSIRMLIALTPVWAYLKEMEFSHPNVSPQQLKEWMEAKCHLAGQRWTNSSSVENMDAMCDYLTGGPIDEDLAIYRLAP